MIFNVLVFFTVHFVCSSSAESVCGQSLHNDDHWDSPHHKIVGGYTTIPNEWPWQVSLRMIQPSITIHHYCGAVVIHPSFILTAAHCVLNTRFAKPDPRAWLVRLGKHNISTREDTELNRTVSAIAVYHLYDRNKFDYDIAIMKLANPIKYTDQIKPACVPHSGMIFKDASCITTGWGRLHSEIPDQSETLQEVDLSVIDNVKCDQLYQEYNISIKPWHFCAGVLVGGKGSCIGDSGGPINCLQDGKWYVAGLTSFGEGCALPKVPDVYTRTSYFSNWIQLQMLIL